MTDPNPIPTEVEHLMNMRKLLTTLGPDNSSSVAENLIRLNCFDTAERVRATVALIVDKALDEPQLAESCARLCSQFADVEVADPPGEPLRFRKVLVNLVQQGWEKTDTEYGALEASLRREEGSELLRKNVESAHNRYLCIIR
ncbi:uncharacterized protein LOC129591524 [Paramacrobiotus metropolitanus]|uniref:uncharacterized protein LOC129591524 n=1 Tax=Paramacrobiotus metropolitanus TaxID=2943436 RepID=UPI002445CEAA|nr:uncharacterized protein LOC129591524 [Paramacrobiotus metropolitanus]